MGQCAQRAKYPLFRVVADGTGVQHDDVGLVGLIGEGAAHLLQHTEDVLAVCHVLLAAEGIHHGLGTAALALVDGFYFLCKFLLKGHCLLGNQNQFSFQKNLPALRF